jgi:hypothetical protein
MVNSIPSAADVRRRLNLLSRKQLLELAAKSDVPFHTLVKIKRGETLSPQLETVRQFWALLGAEEGATEKAAA